MKTTLFIIRHPQATGNLIRHFQGHTDTDLTPDGERQADILAEHFRSIPFDVIYSSDLKRAAVTASKIAAGREHIITPVLREINAGVWEDGDITTFPETHPVESDLWNNEPERFYIENGETMAEVYARVSGFITKIAEKHYGKTVAVVSHGCVIRNLLCFMKYGDIAHLREVEWSNNAAISFAEYEDGCWSVKYMNNEDHLNTKSL
jgi:probable phosphoglycerate mutase